MSFRNREVFRKGMKEHGSPKFTADQEQELAKRILIEKQVFLYNKLYISLITIFLIIIFFTIWHISELNKKYNSKVKELENKNAMSINALNEFKENIEEKEITKINYLYNNWVYNSPDSDWYFDFHKNGNLIKTFHIQGNVHISNENFNINNYPQLDNTYIHDGKKHSNHYSVIHISAEHLILGTKYRGVYPFKRVEKNTKINPFKNIIKK